ncbi:50S ribosomal protein L23 [candidate division GN15 bacterium]|nr:50S ribosomal protein L23 [candidate division GN15 bacterium]
MKSNPRQILRRHLVTERSTILREANNEYVFEVAKRATKHAIKDAVERAFNVKVADVRTMIMPGKIKRMGRNEGKTPTWKKAVVKLQENQSISMFENM